eukprot:scaffold30_cov416-Prasinococcus_capsulatus_cf.AAC.22
MPKQGHARLLGHVHAQKKFVLMKGHVPQARPGPDSVELFAFPIMNLQGFVAACGNDFRVPMHCERLKARRLQAPNQVK